MISEWSTGPSLYIYREGMTYIAKAAPWFVHLYNSHNVVGVCACVRVFVCVCRSTLWVEPIRQSTPTMIKQQISIEIIIHCLITVAQNSGLHVCTWTVIIIITVQVYSCSDYCMYIMHSHVVWAMIIAEWCKACSTNPLGPRLWNGKRPMLQPLAFQSR